MSKGDIDYKSTVGVLLGVGLVIGGLVCLAGYSSSCSKCDKWFSKVTANKVKLREEEAAKDVDRSDKHYDKDGKFTGETKRK